MVILDILEAILRWIVFIFMFSGMIYLSHKKLKIILEFAPIFVCSSIAVIIFLFGIIGHLFIGYVLVLALGISSFIYMMKKIDIKQNNLLKDSYKKISIPNIIFLIGSLCFLIQLLNTNLVHYDNYSHWGLVVKEILITKAFPTADSVMIDFKNYPLGMSSFIYLVCEFIGNTQSNMLFAQGLVIFACFYAIFGIITEKKRILLYVFLALGCSILSIFNITIRINNLLVDFILPVLALAIIAVIYRCRLEINKMYISICPMIALLVIVKNTGVIYAVFAIAYLFYVLIKYKNSHIQKKLMQIENVSVYKKTNGIILFFKTLALLLVSMITTIVWNIHMKVAFAGVENKFEINTDKMQGVYAGKTQEDVKNIIDLFIKTVLDVTSRPTIGIITFELLGIASCIIGIFIIKNKVQLPKAFLALNFMLVLYYVGILGMYIFSMPLDEAIYLAGFERYACSIVIFFGGALSMCATIDLENSFHHRIGNGEYYRSFKSIESKKAYNTGVIACSCIALLILSSEINGLSYYVGVHKQTLPEKVKSIVGDSWEEEVDNNRYLVYDHDTDGQVSNYYLREVAKYYLRANNVETICYFYEDNMLNLLSQYDKLIIIESDKHQRSLMEKYLDVSGEVGIYDLQGVK